MLDTTPLVFSIPEYDYLRDDICKVQGCESGEIEFKTFPDGERYQRIKSPTAGRNVVLVGGTIHDSATLTIYDLAWSFVKNGAHSLTLMMPYFGYSTMERAVKKGEVVVAKARAQLFSAIPHARFGNRIVFLDLHNGSISHYFEGDVNTLNVYCTGMIIEAANRVGSENFVLGSTDAGRAKRVEALGKELGVDVAFVYKRRLSGSTTEVTGVSANVAGRNVVIYDDMIRTGGSLIGAAKAYKSAGARQIGAVATHGLFPGQAFKRLQDSGLFTSIACTDSHPRTRDLISEGLQVVSVASVLGRHLID